MARIGRAQGLSGFSLWLSVTLLLFLGTTPTRAQDAQGYALRFYGHGVGDIDRVKVLIDPQVPVDVGGDLTLEFWMRAFLAENGSGSCTPGNDNWITGNIIVDRDIWGPGDSGDYGVSLAGGVIAFGVNVGGNGAGICGTTGVADGAWHHVAVTRRASDGELRIYVDGDLDGSGAGPVGDLSYRDGRSTGGNPNDPYLVFGAEKHDAGGAFPSYSGWLDEVRVSDVLRYTGGSYSVPGGPFSPDGDTVGLYHFDEGPAGDCVGAVVDSSGAGGGPSSGACSFGGSAPAGPVYTTEIPFGAVETAPTEILLPTATASEGPALAASSPAAETPVEPELTAPPDPTEPPATVTVEAGRPAAASQANPWAFMIPFGILIIFLAWWAGRQRTR